MIFVAVKMHGFKLLYKFAHLKCPTCDVALTVIFEACKHRQRFPVNHDSLFQVSQEPELPPRRIRLHK